MHWRRGSQRCGVRDDRRCPQQLDTTAERFLFRPVCQETEMADALKSVGENVKKKPPDKFFGVQSHRTLLCRLAIAIKKGHGVAVDGNDTVIGDGDTMG